MCYDFVKLTFVKQSPGMLMNHSSTKDHKGIEIEKFISHRSQRIYMAHLQGPPLQGGQGKVQAERAIGHGAHAFSGVYRWSVGASKLRLGWSIETKDNRVWVSSKGVLPKGHTKGRPWEARETITRTAGNIVSGT